MSDNIIQSFLVSFGWKFDKDSEREFDTAVKKLKTALEAIAVGVGVYEASKWLNGVTSGLEKVNFAAQRAHASVQKLQAFMYAASQTGSTKDQALSAAVTFGQWMKNTPGAAQLLRNNLGVNSTDANGNPLDTTDIMRAVGVALNKQIPALQKTYGGIFGMPDELRWAVQNSAAFGGFEDKEIARQQRMGGDPGKIAAQGQKFQQMIRDLGQTFDDVGQRVAGGLTENRGLGSAIERFSAVLEKHVPDIVHFVNAFMDAVIPLLDRFIGWLGKLSPAEIKAFFEGLAAFVLLLGGMDLASKALNLLKIGKALGLLAGPEVLLGLGAITAAAVAIKSAYDAMHGKDASNPVSNAAEGWLPSIYRKIGYAGAGFMGMFGDKDALWATRNHFGRNPPNHTGDFHGLPSGSSGGGGGILGALESSFGLPPGTLSALMRIESNGVRGLISSKGAQGLFQFMPATAARFGVTDPNDLQNAGTGAAKYFAYLLKHYNGNSELAAAGYNWGEGHLDNAIKKWGANVLHHLPAETTNYVRNFDKLMANPYGLKKASGSGPSASTGQGVNVTSQTTINVNGAGDPLAVANRVGGAQANESQRLARNLRQVFA